MFLIIDVGCHITFYLIYIFQLLVAENTTLDIKITFLAPILMEIWPF